MAQNFYSLDFVFFLQTFSQKVYFCRLFLKKSKSKYKASKSRRCRT